VVAQAQAVLPAVIGYLAQGAQEGSAEFVSSVRKGLGEAGLVEGKDFTTRFSWARFNADLLAGLAADLVQRRAAVIITLDTVAAARAAKTASIATPVVFVVGTDPVQAGLVASLNRPGGNVTGISTMNLDLGSKLIVTSTTPATAAAQRGTRTIPIVFAGVGDPVVSGIVERLDRPSGNITGFALYEPSLAGKQLELLSEIAPGLKRAAIMSAGDAADEATVRGSSATMHSFETAARSLRIVLSTAPVHSDVEIEKDIRDLGREAGGGLVVSGAGFLSTHRVPIILAAARNKQLYRNSALVA
jgi:ABC-type uncharacterized transport system substrate-binding protein